MRVLRDDPPEVQFGTLAPGDVFTESGKAHVKITKQEHANWRYNALALEERLLVTCWLDDMDYVYYYPDAVLRLGQPAEARAGAQREGGHMKVTPC